VKVIFQRRKWARTPARNLELTSQNLERIGERSPQRENFAGGDKAGESDLLTTARPCAHHERTDAQAAVCNHFHTTDQRLACWLLLARDRIRNGAFNLTYEAMAQILGVSRSGVSSAAV
jgi:hypothetical protein